MNINIKLLDRRFKKTIIYLTTGKGAPIYKKSSFKNISKILGPQSEWINILPEEYFGDDPVVAATKAIKILNFSSNDSLFTIKQKYKTLSKTFHPDRDGHPNAFAILNQAYSIFKNAFYDAEV